MKKVISIIKVAAILFCSLFTAGTLANTIGVLYFGLNSNTDVHGHIMSRAGLVLFITVVVTFVFFMMKGSLAKSRTEKGLLLKYVLSCVIVLSSIFVFIWALSSGHLWVNEAKIHPDAFGDLLRSVLLPASIVAIVGFFIILIRKPKR